MLIFHLHFPRISSIRRLGLKCQTVIIPPIADFDSTLHCIALGIVDHHKNVVTADVDGHVVNMVLIEIDIDQSLPDIVGLLMSNADRQIILGYLIAVNVLETGLRDYP